MYYEGNHASQLKTEISTNLIKHWKTNKNTKTVKIKTQ